MRKVLLFTLCALMVFAMTTTVYAKNGKNGKNGQSGKSNTGHLYFYEKTPMPLTTPPTPWPIVEDGAWGKMKYNLSGETLDIVFNGHGLEPEECYTLIYYPDLATPPDPEPWPRVGIICLGSACATPEVEEDPDAEPEPIPYSPGGNVHIKSSTDTGDLPTVPDINDGAKFWLVLSADVDCINDPNVMFGWNPTEYLFEATWTGIGFDDTDTAPGRGSTKTTTWATIKSQ